MKNIIRKMNLQMHSLNKECHRRDTVTANDKDMSRV